MQKENESLRGLLNSQQTALNELSGLVMKILSNGIHTYIGEGPNRGHDNGDVSSSNNSNGVYDSSEGVVQHIEQDMTESNYVFNQDDGVHGGGNLEKVEEVEEDEEELDDENEDDENEDEEDENDIETQDNTKQHADEK